MHLDSRKEALLNEYKGNLFEFLVAGEVAKLKNCESLFLKSINSSFSSMLKQQESYIRNFYPDLLVKLPILAKRLAESICAKLSIDKVKKISLIGKSAATSVSEYLGEADLIICGPHKEYLISVKLNKATAATNTKSAGVKSFLVKYFHDAYDVQQKVNKEFDKLFDEFSFSLHNENALEWDRNFNEWAMRGLPSLPGELTGKSRQLYLDFIHDASDLYYRAVKDLSHSSHFYKSIFSLIGFSKSEIIQATCYHKDNYNHGDFQVISIEDTISDEFEIIEKKGTSYFEIKFNSLSLHIRIKAMNKFINKSFKVNCSVKY